MRRVLAVFALGLFVAAALALMPHPEPEFVPETPNIGVGSSPLLPHDQPLSATLFLTGGAGVASDPYGFCLVSALRDGRPSCLFNVSLLGFPEELEALEWYRLTASFAEKLAGNGVAGRLLSASPIAAARVAGPALERESRFHEESEALSNWAVAQGVNGYLRIDGTYVWYLSEQAAATVNGVDTGPVRVTWTPAG